MAYNRGVKDIEIKLIPGTEANTITSTTDIKTEFDGLTINTNPLRIYLSDTDSEGTKWKFEEVPDSTENTYFQVYKYNKNAFQEVATFNKNPYQNKYTFNFSSDLNNFSYQDFIDYARH